VSGTLPPRDELTAGWWDATRARRLVVQRCVACGRLQHPPRPLCVGCLGEALEWTEMSGAATVDAWTTVARAPGPDFSPPYVEARVRLREGPLLLTRLVGPHLHCGQAVTVAWSPLADGRHLPVFQPLQGAAP
jgi:uncharacterized OB-fold protein